MSSNPQHNASTEQLQSLLERLEKAEGPDREIDVDIAILILGFVYERRGRDKKAWFYPPGANKYQRYSRESYSSGIPLPRYTASLDCAIALVEKALPGFLITVRVGGGWEEASAYLYRFQRPTFSASSNHIALTLLTALIKALIAETEK